VVKELRTIEFNVVQQHELIQQRFLTTTCLGSPFPSEVTLMVCGDIISAFSKLEEEGAQCTRPPEPKLSLYPDVPVPRVTLLKPAQGSQATPIYPPRRARLCLCALKWRQQLPSPPQGGR